MAASGLIVVTGVPTWGCTPHATSLLSSSSLGGIMGPTGTGWDAGWRGHFAVTSAVKTHTVSDIQSALGIGLLRVSGCLSVASSCNPVQTCIVKRPP